MPAHRKRLAKARPTPAFYRRVALKSDDDTLVRTCLLLASKQIKKTNGIRRKGQMR